MKAIALRLARVTEAEAVRRLVLGPPVLIVWPDDWPAADRAAFDAAAAAGDGAARRELVERHVGQRPGPGTILIEFRVRTDGPA